MRQQLRSVLEGERLGFYSELCLSGLIKLRRRCCPACDRNTDCLEELLLPGRRAKAQQSHRLAAGVVELMRRVDGDIDGFACLYNRFFAAKGGFNLTFQQDECFFKVMAMRRRAAARRDVYVNQAVAACRVFAREKKRVSITHNTKMRQTLVFVRLCKREMPLKVIRRQRGGGLSGFDCSSRILLNL